MSGILLNITTALPYNPSEENGSNKDVLLVVASVAMVVATLLLIVVVCKFHMS